MEGIPMKPCKPKKNYPKKMLGKGVLEEVATTCPNIVIRIQSKTSDRLLTHYSLRFLRSSETKGPRSFYWLKFKSFGSYAMMPHEPNLPCDFSSCKSVIDLNSKEHFKSAETARKRTEKMLRSLMSYRDYLKEKIDSLWGLLESFCDRGVIGSRRVMGLTGYKNTVRYERPGEGERYLVWDFTKGPGYVYAQMGILDCAPPDARNTLKNIANVILPPDEEYEKLVLLTVRRIERETAVVKTVENLALLYRKLCFLEAEQKEPRKTDHLYVIHTNLGVHHIDGKDKEKDISYAIGLQIVDLREEAS
jgi:hypothetical protein